MDGSVRWTRRRFLARSFLALGGTALGTGSYVCGIEPHWLEVVERTLRLPGLPPGWEGARAVQVSDLHAGPKVDGGYLRRTLDRVAALDPDLLLLTGDHTTLATGARLGPLMDALERLRPARRGTFGALGNHDYGASFRDLATGGRVAWLLRDAGVRVLRNEAVDVDGLQIVGLEDRWAPSWDPAAALARVDPRRPSIALCHNPDGADDPAWAGFRGWILAGHTHGGQCRPPFLPPPILPVRNKRYTAGPFPLAPGRAMYVSRGVGHLLRVRFNVRPEVTVFTLTGSPPA